MVDRPDTSIATFLRGRTALLLLAASLLALFAWSWAHLIEHVIDYSDGASTELREDFAAFYAAGSMLATDQAWRLYDPDVVAHIEEHILQRPAGRGTGLAFMNPPFVAGLVEPLTGLSYGHAQAVWFALGVLAIAGSIALLRPELQRMGRRRAALFLLAVLGSFPVTASLLYGQLSPFVLLAWAAFYRLSTGGRHASAGLALAGALIKPQLAFVPVLYLLATRRWRALGGFAAGAAVLAVVSATLASWRTTFVDYPMMLVHSVTWRSEFGMNRVNMFGWNSFLTRAFPQDEHTLVLALTVVLSLATVALAWLVWRRQGDLADGSRPMLALAAATILASPHMHKHDLEILIIPVALLAAYRTDAGGSALAALLLFLLPLATIGPNLAPPLLAVVLLVVVARSFDLPLTRPLSVPGERASPP